MPNLRTSDPSLWFQCLSTASKPLLKLFCFPYAGGNAAIFRDWQSHFPSYVDVCLVHLPGRGRRFNEQPHVRMNTLVKAIADAMDRERPCPFAFYGHSLGALIGFELARELRRRRRAGPLQLFLSSQQAPQTAGAARPIFNLSHDEFIAELRRLNGTPEQLLDDPEMREIILPILRADFEVLDTYKHRSERPLSCPITVYGGRQDDGFPVRNLHAWKEQTRAGCKVEMFPGDHFFIHDARTNFIKALRSDVVSSVNESQQTLKKLPQKKK